MAKDPTRLKFLTEQKLGLEDAIAKQQFDVNTIDKKYAEEQKQAATAIANFEKAKVALADAKVGLSSAKQTKDKAKIDAAAAKLEAAKSVYSRAENEKQRWRNGSGALGSSLREAKQRLAKMQAELRTVLSGLKAVS